MLVECKIIRIFQFCFKKLEKHKYVKNDDFWPDLLVLMTHGNVKIVDR